MSDPEQEQIDMELSDEGDDCVAFCVDCGAPIWEDCYYCNDCLRQYKWQDESDEYDA